MDNQNQLQHTYFLNRRFFQVLGAKMSVVDSNNQEILFGQLTRLKLKEEINIYSDSSKSQVVFSIKSRQVIDFSATYDIFDSEGLKLGAIRRKGLSSKFLRDNWVLLDNQDQEVGTLVEDSSKLGFLRRLSHTVSLVLPQQYDVVANDVKIAEYRRTFHIFKVQYNIALREPFSAQVNTMTQLSLVYPFVLAIIEEDKG